ncbi:MAG: DNA gyrase subunit A [Planctomycetota bacterium]|jgi:DNA gyrase subunit A
MADNETHSGVTELPDAGARITDMLVEDEMKDSYLRYAMSVIVSRALPDARDGLKPSQRRILLAMNDINAGPRGRKTKCASIVGETMKKYHPHGDQAIYPTMVRLAQHWNIRYQLIEPQGNFGSPDGDSPAAMRYTEARMRQSAADMLEDLDKNTVDFRPNFDDTTVEPVVLPSKFPNLLVNGSQGIAVGMATSIPPHNLREVAAAITAMLDDPEMTIDQIMEHIPAPDFPTGGILCGRAGVLEAYRTGRGRVKVRGVASITELPNGRERIVISEIPYQVNKGTLVEKIAALANEGKIEGISHLNDESGRHEAVRIVIDIKRDGAANVVLNQLYKHTPLQSTFSIITIALVGGRPETLNIKQMLECFIDHRVEVIRRRTQYLLDKAEARKHIIEGLKIAVDNIDEVIELIRSASSGPDASAKLQERFGLSSLQADAILSMQLRKLTGLERKKLDEEYEQVLDEIADFRDILDRRERVDQIIKDDVTAGAERYGDARRTKIGPPVDGIEIEDLIPEQFMAVTITQQAYIKRTPLATYQAQNRGGKGIFGAKTKEEDFMKDLFVAHTHSTLLFFTNLGRVYSARVFEVPEGSRTSKGRAMANVLPLMPNEKVEACRTIRDFAEAKDYLLFVTERGVVKKTDVQAFSRVLGKGIIAINLNEGDRVIDVQPVSEGDEVFIGTRHGRAIRFNEADARSMGRTARGVRGIRLREGDLVVGMAIRRSGASLLTICEHGYGKQTEFDEYRQTARGGIGVINIKTSKRNGSVIAVLAAAPDEDLVLISQSGNLLRMAVGDIRTIGRNTQGVKIMNLADGDSIVSAARSPKEDISREEEEAARAAGAGIGAALTAPGDSHDTPTSEEE